MWMQTAAGDHVNACSDDVGGLHLDTGKIEQGESGVTWFHEQVDVGVDPGRVTGDGAEQQEAANAGRPEGPFMGTEQRQNAVAVEADDVRHGEQSSARSKVQQGDHSVHRHLDHRAASP